MHAIMALSGRVEAKRSTYVGGMPFFLPEGHHVQLMFTDPGLRAGPNNHAPYGVKFRFPPKVSSPV
jgi:hypothetical protein